MKQAVHPDWSILWTGIILCHKRVRGIRVEIYRSPRWLNLIYFKLHISPSGGIEVGYFLLGASLAKLAMMKRCTNSSFIAISILNCAEHLFVVKCLRIVAAEERRGGWSTVPNCNNSFFARNAHSSGFILPMLLLPVPPRKVCAWV